MYSGVAPGAQLCVEDLGTGTGLCAPLAKQLVSGPYKAGARVFSNSWDSFYTGNGNGYYNSADIDNMLHKHEVG